MYEGNMMLQCPASSLVCIHCCLAPSTSTVKPSTVPTCHAPLQEVTEPQERRPLLLDICGTGLPPSHAHCFGVPNSVRSLLLIPECQDCQEMRCRDTVGRNPTLVTSRQCSFSEKAACNASQPLVLLKNGIWVTCVCHAVLAAHDALQLPCGLSAINTGLSGSSCSWQLRFWSPGALALGWWTPRRMPNLPKS